MNLQFISDSNGETTGVYIPIAEWNELKSKFKEIEQEEINIPGWHIDVIKQRLEHYRNNPDQKSNFELAMDKIEKDL